MKALPLLGAALAWAIAAAAVAQPQASPDREPARMMLRTGDLDLARSEGATAALRRIRHLAAETCGTAPSLRNLRETQAYRACVDDNTTRTVEALASPLVSSLYGDVASRARLAAVR